MKASNHLHSLQTSELVGRRQRLQLLIEAVNATLGFHRCVARQACGRPLLPAQVVEVGNLLKN